MGVLNQGEAAATDDRAGEDRKPHLEPAVPRGMFRGEMNKDAMARVAQGRLASRHRLENAVFALSAEIAGQADSHLFRGQMPSSPTDDFAIVGG